jgi:hypothetical protein
MVEHLQSKALELIPSTEEEIEKRRKREKKRKEGRKEGRKRGGEGREGKE